MIGILGLGYVGLPLAVSLAQSDLKVVGYDINVDVIAEVSSGHSHIQDVTDEALRSALGAALTVTHAVGDLAACSTYIICVPTPLGVDGAPDTSSIQNAARLVAQVISKGDLVILESTSYPGTTEEVLARLIGEATGMCPGQDFHVAFSPERVDPGNLEFTHANTPKIVAGLTDRCLERAIGTYEVLGGAVIPADGIREAELAKLLENTYRQVNIALMNEMAKFCRALDIDLYESIRLAATKPFGFQAFYPGPGVGGHCIPIDPKYLAARVQSRLGESFRFVELAQEINESMPHFVFDRLMHELRVAGKSIDTARVLLLGVTYKPNVADTRESPATDLAQLLVDAGAHVSYFDPLIDHWHDAPASLTIWREGDHANFDASVLLQQHNEILKLDIESLAGVCLDTRGVLAGLTIRRL